MGEIRPLPNPGDVFSDVRDPDRTMRVSYHADAGIVVVSLWSGRLCRASFRMAADEAARLVTALGQAALASTAAPADVDAEAPTAQAS
jgi:hypothetical protein